VKIASLTLDDREREDRREVIENKIAGRHWHACVASVDLRYVAPIIIDAKGRYEISRPIEFRRLGIKGKMKKFFSDIRREGEKMIFEAAAMREESPPLLTIFGPVEKKRPAWKRTRNVFDCKQQGGAGIELIRFRPQEIGWRASIRRVISLDLSPAAKILLLYAYDRGFESGEFFASSKTTSDETQLHSVHVKRLLAHLAKLAHFERLRKDASGVWRYGFLAPADELRGNFKLPEQGAQSGAGNLKLPPAVTLGSPSGNLPLPKADKASRNEKTRTSIRPLLAPDGERELLAQISEILGIAEMQKNGGMWRNRIRRDPNGRRALLHTIEDYKVRTPQQRATIRHLPKWFTDRYLRNLVKISMPR
jgi:hypothetical protein